LKTKRGGAKNGQSPLLIRSEMEISNKGQMANPELLKLLNKGNNKITELRTILQRESPNS
jgi:hypothetical protein